MPKLALSMIVKDAERDLPDCLRSVQGIVDQMVVADTGSADATVAIARSSDAKVISIPWEDDFAKARNLSLAEVTAEWVLVLDADERLDPAAASLLPVLLANAEVAGYQVTLRNYVTTLTHKIWDRSAKRNDSSYPPARSYSAYVDHENVRLFRRDPEIYFTGRVHETVGWRILACKRIIADSRLVIHHMGMVRDPGERARKILFYLNLGRQKASEMPENSQAHFELGLSELENLGNARDALPSFERACELNPRLGVSWFFAGICHFRLAAFTKALDCFRQAEVAGHSTPSLAEMIGDSHYNLGNYQAACDYYRRGSRQDPSSAALESKLGLAETRAGSVSAGLRKLRRAIERDPAGEELYDRLIMVELWLNRPLEGALVAERKLKATSPQPKDFLRAASIRAKMQQRPQAKELLRQGFALFPDSEPIRAALASLETLTESPDTFAERVTSQPKNSLLKD